MDDLYEAIADSNRVAASSRSEQSEVQYGERIWYPADVIDDSNSMMAIYNTLLFGRRCNDMKLAHYVANQVEPLQVSSMLTQKVRDSLRDNSKVFERTSQVVAAKKKKKKTRKNEDSEEEQEQQQDERQFESSLSVVTNHYSAELEFDNELFARLVDVDRVSQPIDLVVRQVLAPYTSGSEVSTRMLLKNIMHRPLGRQSDNSFIRSVEQQDESLIRNVLLKKVLIDSLSEKEWQEAMQADWSDLRPLPSAASNLVYEDSFVNVRALSFVIHNLISRYIHLVLFTQVWLLPLWEKEPASINLFESGYTVYDSNNNNQVLVQIVSLEDVVQRALWLWSLFQQESVWSVRYPDWTLEQLKSTFVSQFSQLFSDCFGMVDDSTPLPTLVAPRLNYSQGALDPSLLNGIPFKWRDLDAKSVGFSFLHQYGLGKDTFAKEWARRTNHVLSYRMQPSAVTDRGFPPNNPRFLTNKYPIENALSVAVEEYASMTLPIMNDDVQLLVDLLENRKSKFAQTGIETLTTLSKEYTVEETVVSPLNSFQTSQVPHTLAKESVSGLVNTDISELVLDSNAIRSFIAKVRPKHNLRYWRDYFVMPNISVEPSIGGGQARFRYSQKTVIADTPLGGRVNLLRWSYDRGALVSVLFAPLMNKFHNNEAQRTEKSMSPMFNLQRVMTSSIPNAFSNDSRIAIDLFVTDNPYLRWSFLSRKYDLVYASKSNQSEHERRNTSKTDSSVLASSILGSYVYNADRIHRVPEALALELRQTFSYSHFPSFEKSDDSVWYDSESTDVIHNPLCYGAMLPLVERLAPSGVIYPFLVPIIRQKTPRRTLIELLSK